MTLTELLVPKGKYQEMVVDYLLNYTVENNWNRVEETQKPFSECWKHIVDEARKVKEGNCAMVDDTTVYKWAVEFYEEKKVPAAQIKAAVPVKKAKEKKQEVDDEQLTLF